jgi:hypothetical protein
VQEPAACAATATKRVRRLKEPVAHGATTTRRVRHVEEPAARGATVTKVRRVEDPAPRGATTTKRVACASSLARKPYTRASKGVDSESSSEVEILVPKTEYSSGDDSGNESNGDDSSGTQQTSCFLYFWQILSMPLAQRQVFGSSISSSCINLHQFASASICILTEIEIWNLVSEEIMKLTLFESICICICI